MYIKSDNRKEKGMRTRTNSATWSEKQQRWSIQIQVDGVRRAFYSSTPGAAGKRECHAKADRWLQSGLTNETKRMRVAVPEWLETLKPTREGQSSSCYRQYEGFMRVRILPMIENKRVSEVSNGDIQKIIDKGVRDGLSKKTLQNIRGCMVAFFKWARKNKLSDLRVEDIDIPWDAPKVQKEILQPDALGTLMSTDTRMCRGQLVEDYYVNAYRFQLVTGLRPGELLARTKADVRDGYLYITSARNTFGEITRGKNENAVRRIKLTPLALNILKQQAEMEKRYNVSSTLLFPDKDGGYIEEHKLYKNWKAYQRGNNIPIISLYELRHTFVSVCAETVPENLLKLVVGHSESMDTQGVYGHEVNGQLDRAADAIMMSFERVK